MHIIYSEAQSKCYERCTLLPKPFLGDPWIPGVFLVRVTKGFLGLSWDVPSESN